MTNSKHPTTPEVVMALWKNALHKAEIIEKRQGAEAGKLEYYLHYIGFDHRLDEWVSADRVSALSAIKKESPHDEARPRLEEAGPAPPQPDARGGGRRHEPDATRRSTKRATKRKREDLEGDEAQPSTADATRPRCSTPPASGERMAAGAQDAEASGVVAVAAAAAAAAAAQEELTKVRNVEAIQLGKYEISTWYYSPFPDEFISEGKRMIVCEYCLKYMRTEGGINCRSKKPPGRVLYAKDGLKIYEVDGKHHKLYCQNLCLVAKLFLDHKTLYYDVEGFWFYVLTEADERERNVDHVVGYFSKEKISYENYNLACILISPPYQRKGYGRLLIEFSYELSKHQGKIGSPEQPLSDLGLRGYQSFWSSALLGLLRAYRGAITVRQLSQMTCIREEDVISTLGRLGLFRYRQRSKSGQREICITGEMIEEAINANGVKLDRMLDTDAILWQDEAGEDASKGKGDAAAGTAAAGTTTMTMMTTPMATTAATAAASTSRRR